MSDILIDSKSFEDIMDFYDEAYRVFKEDFIECAVYFDCQEVGLINFIRTKGKEETYWHVISNEAPKYSSIKTTKERYDDIKRAERVGWIKEIIENWKDCNIRVFLDPKYHEPRIHFWYKTDYVVVLVKKPSKPYYRLLTAFLTDKESKKREFEKLFKSNPYIKADAAEAASNPNKP